ncbi:MAG: hypothetical protein J6X89_05740 [Bacteroidales bacterium]|nr:hypothetical protein [Bacteroidales bacterium]
MDLIRHILKYILAVMAAALLVQGCSLIDEDLSDCETDYNINYELRLVTNMTTELQTQLETEVSTEVDVAAGAALREYLKDIFTDHAHDVDLSFYDVSADSLRLHHEAHIMDANQSSYTLYIPVHRYMHTTVANVLENNLVTLQKDERCHTGTLHQEIADTISAHTTGLFTARLPMEVIEGIDQTFDVKLYMANCAAALVVDTTGSHIKNLKVYMTGFATDFDICDSLYHYRYTPIVRTDNLKLTAPGMCFATVTYPSRDVRETKTVIETTDPFISEDAEKGLWQIRTYLTLEDGTVTETKLSVTKPLRAGQLKVFKAKALFNGAVQPDDPEVGVSVALDWQTGQTHEIPL